MYSLRAASHSFRSSTWHDFLTSLSPRIFSNARMMNISLALDLLIMLTRAAGVGDADDHLQCRRPPPSLTVFDDRSRSKRAHGTILQKPIRINSRGVASPPRRIHYSDSRAKRITNIKTAVILLLLGNVIIVCHPKFQLDAPIRR